MCLHPLAWTNVSSEKNACFAIWAHVGTKFLNYVPSFPIYGWLAWWCDFFLWGQSVKIIRKYSSKKNPAPCIFLGHLRLGLLKSPLYTFCGWWSWTCVSVPFCKDKCIPSKNMCFAIWARVDTKFLNSSHHVLSLDDWPGDATFFPVGPTFEDHPQVFGQKGPAPLILFLTPAPRLLEVTVLHFFGWWSWTRVPVPFCKDKCIFTKSMCLAEQFWRALTQNSWIRPIMSYLWMIGLMMRLFSCGANLWRSSASIQPKKGPAFWISFLTPALRPLQITFLVGEAEHVCLYSFARTNIFSAKKHVFCNLGARWHIFLNLSHHVLSMDDRVMRLFSCGASLWRSSTSRVQPLGFYFWHLRLGLFKSPFFWLKLNMCVCTLLQSHVGNHTTSNNHGTFFPGVWRTYMF